MTDEPAKKPPRKRAPAKKAVKATAITKRAPGKRGRPVAGSPDEIRVRERDIQAMELRKAGMSFPSIAKQLGYADSGHAYRSIDALLTRTEQEVADSYRKLEVERMDALFRPMYTQGIQGNRNAVDRCLKIMERRAALLGLDAPIRIQQLVVTDEDLEKAIERFNAEAEILESRAWADTEDAVVVDDDDTPPQLQAGE